MDKYEFDAVRFCRSNKGRMGRLPDGSDPMERIAAAMDAERRLAELQEAVRWERECWSWTCNNETNAEKWGLSEQWNIRRAARDAVDALVGE